MSPQTLNQWRGSPATPRRARTRLWRRRALGSSLRLRLLRGRMPRQHLRGRPRGGRRGGRVSPRLG